MYPTPGVPNMGACVVCTFIVHGYTYVCTYVCMYVSICTYVCSMYVCMMYVCMYVCMYVHGYTVHMCVHVCTHWAILISSGVGCGEQTLGLDTTGMRVSMGSQ